MKLQDKEIKDDNHRGELLSISTCFLQTKMVQKYCRNIVEIETAVDIVLQVLKNSQANACSKVLSKVIAGQHGVC